MLTVIYRRIWNCFVQHRSDKVTCSRYAPMFLSWACRMSNCEHRCSRYETSNNEPKIYYPCC